MKNAEEFLQQLKQRGELDFELANAEAGANSDSALIAGLEIDADTLEALSKLRQQIESRAVMLLAIREHGAKELQNKLLSKFPETPELLQQTQQPSGLIKILVEEVIQLCQEENWQSDERYIEQSVRSLMEKGQGPIKIRQKLQQACSNSSLIDAYLDIDIQNWLEVARGVMLKKYGDLSKPKSRNEQAKRMRFLQSRGFSSEVIWKVFR